MYGGAEKGRKKTISEWVRERKGKGGMVEQERDRSRGRKRVGQQARGRGAKCDACCAMCAEAGGSLPRGPMLQLVRSSLAKTVLHLRPSAISVQP
jgi:hypothetical protein